MSAARTGSLCPAASTANSSRTLSRRSRTTSTTSRRWCVRLCATARPCRQRSRRKRSSGNPACSAPASAHMPALALTWTRARDLTSACAAPRVIPRARCECVCPPARSPAREGGQEVELPAVDHRRGSRRSGGGDHPGRQVILSYAFLPGPRRAGTLPRGGAAPQSGAAHVTTKPSINSPPLALAPPPPLRCARSVQPCLHRAVPCRARGALRRPHSLAAHRGTRSGGPRVRRAGAPACTNVRIAHWYRVGARVRISKSRPVLRSAFRRGRPCAPRAADRQSKLRSAALSAQRFRRAEDLPARARARRARHVLRSPLRARGARRAASHPRPCGRRRAIWRSRCREDRRRRRRWPCGAPRRASRPRGRRRRRWSCPGARGRSRTQSTRCVQHGAAQEHRGGALGNAAPRAPTFD